MAQFTKVVANFWDKNQKLLKIVLSAVLALCFVGSVLIAVFCGGEFTTVAQVEAKGMMMFTQSSYKSSYFSGDKFSFDRDKTKIRLLAKVPGGSTVDILDLHSYGFKVNGEGEMIYDAQSITMTEDVTSVSVVSKEFSNLKIDIPVSVLNVDDVVFTNAVTLEAEEADVYLSGELLTYEDLTTKPDADKPFLSNAGTGANVNPAGTETCSGEACLRNVGTNSMNIDFKVVCKEDTTVSFQILVCKRKEDSAFVSWFKIKLNGENYSGADNVIIPARVSGTDTDYFTSYTTETIEIELTRGVNVISFVSTGSAPGNLDAIKLAAASDILGVLSVQEG